MICIQEIPSKAAIPQSILLIIDMHMNVMLKHIIFYAEKYEWKWTWFIVFQKLVNILLTEIYFTVFFFFP